MARFGCCREGFGRGSRRSEVVVRMGRRGTKQVGGDEFVLSGSCGNLLCIFWQFISVSCYFQWPQHQTIITII